MRAGPAARRDGGRRPRRRGDRAGLGPGRRRSRGLAARCPPCHRGRADRARRTPADVVAQLADPAAARPCSRATTPLPARAAPAPPTLAPARSTARRHRRDVVVVDALVPRAARDDARAPRSARAGSWSTSTTTTSGCCATSATTREADAYARLAPRLAARGRPRARRRRPSTPRRWPHATASAVAHAPQRGAAAGRRAAAPPAARPAAVRRQPHVRAEHRGGARAGRARCSRRCDATCRTRRSTSSVAYDDRAGRPRRPRRRAPRRPGARRRRPATRAPTSSSSRSAQGAGTRIKVLEAFAHRRPVVATPAAVAGLDVRDGATVLLGDDPPTLAPHVARLLGDPARARGAGRRGVDARARPLRSRCRRAPWRGG